MTKRLIFSAIWTLMLLIVAEMALSRIFPQRIFNSFGSINRCFKADDILYVLHKPNSVCINKSREFDVTMHINEQGFRTTSHPIIDTASSILLIGDSFTFGHGVKDEESYPAVFESSLRSTGNSVNILNAGISGVGLDWYYLFLKEKAKKYKPSAIVVGFFLGNDMFDHLYFDTTIRDTNGVPKKLQTSSEFLLPDGTRTYTQAPLRYRITMLRNSHLFQIAATALVGPISTSEAQLTNGSPCFFQHECHTLDEHIQHTKVLFNAMKEQADSMNIPLFIALIPWEAQLPHRLIERSNGQVYAVGKENRYLINKEILSYCEYLRLSCIDLLPAFEAYTGDDQVFFPQDTHWTATGHRIAGEYLASKLEAILFPPSKKEME